MKKLLLKTMLLLFALIAGSSSVWAAEEVYKTALFGSSYNDKNGSYTSSFDATNGTFVVTATNFNNNNNGWTNASGNGQIKCGRKNTESVGTITTKAAIDKAITKVVVTIDAFTSGKVNSIKMYTSSDNSSWTEAGSFTIATGEQAVELETPTANLYYKVEFDCASGTSNGLVTVSKVEYYTTAVATDPTIIFSNGNVRVGQSLDLSTLFTSNSTGAVTYSITTGDSYASLDESTLTGDAEGSVTVKAEQAAAGNYNAGEATATITVNPALALSGIAVTTAPTKTTYNEGETFDPTGMVITATYSDNSTEAVTGYSYSPNGALTTSDTEITISYTENAVEKTTTQAITVNEVLDYATLPFNWAGGVSSDLIALTGVTANGLGGDYAESHDPYRIKFDTEGDYIQVKTNAQPGVVTVGVKMIGGNTTSNIIVKQSADGETFTDVETLAISGAQNSTHDLETANAFASTSRYVRLYFNKGANVGVGAITIAQATSDPVINAVASVELTAEETSGEIAYTISNPVGGTSLTAAEKVDVDWISNVTVDASKVTFTTTTNTGSERTGTITLTYGSVTKDVTVIQAEHIDINTYTLATAITSGKHYVISTAAGTVVMGGKNDTKEYYNAISGSTLSGTTLSVASNLGAREFVIYGPDASGFYSIYDPVADGYLYASSSDENYLSVLTTNDENGLWAIDFENETVTAQGSNTHNLLRYNSVNPRFSCYQSGQTAVAFYEKSGEATPTESKTVNAKGYATYCSQNALDFTNATGGTAWAVTGISGTTITFAQITGAVPAGTGLLLMGEANATITIPCATGAAALATNLLEGITTATDVAADAYYGLSGDEFVKVNAGTVPAGKALLPVSSVDVKAFTFVFEDATGIESIQNSKSEIQNTIFDLSGRRVVKPTKGLYIVNGKKIVK